MQDLSIACKIKGMPLQEHIMTFIGGETEWGSQNNDPLVKGEVVI